MRNILSTIGLAALLSWATAGVAEEPRYRVEVIVLSHIGHAEAAQETASLRDYGDALDFLSPEPPAEEEETAATEESAQPSIDADTATDGETVDPALEAEDEAEPPAVVHVEELGDVMRDAWRRLRLSGPFRPLVALAWEQPSTPPFPELRIHDQTVVMTEDPWAAIRERLKAGEDVEAWIQAGLVPPLPSAPVAGEGAIPPALGAVMPADDAPPDDPASAMLEALPPPRPFYALDGVVSLVRSRFLHFEIDLQQREAVYAESPERPLTLPRGLRTMPPAEPPVAEDPAMGTAMGMATPTAFRVFEMRQRRQVRTGQVEYFDSPVLGVLAYVTELEPEAQED